MTSSADERTSARDRALRDAAVGGLASRFAVMALGLVSFALCSRSLDVASFGVLASLSALSVIVLLADFGIGLGLVAQLAQAYGRDDLARMRTLVGGAAVALCVVGLVATMTLLALASTLPLEQVLGARSVNGEALVSAAQAFAWAAGLAIPASIGQQIQIGLQRGAQVVSWSAVEAVGVVMCVAVIAAVDGPLWMFVAAMVGTPTAVRAVQTSWVLAKPGLAIRPNLSDLTLSAVPELVRLSLLFFVMGLASAVFLQSGLLILGHVSGAASAAVFAVTIKLFGSISSTAALASRQFWPAASEAIARNDGWWVRTRFQRSLRLAVIVSALGSLLLVVVGQPLIGAWMGEELVPPVPLLILAAIWTVYLVGMNQVAYLLNAAHVIREQMLCALALTAGNLILCWYFTHRFGIYGPFVGGLLAHVALTGAIAVHLCRRELAKLRPYATPVN